MAEHAPRVNAHDLTPADVFYRFSDVLKDRNWSGDSHRLSNIAVPILSGETSVDGMLSLDDYLSFESKQYPRRPAGSHEAGHRYVLEAGVAILGLQFSIGRRPILAPTDYALCIPDSVKEDSVMGYYFYGIYDEGVEPLDALIGMPTDPSVPTILQRQRIGTGFDHSYNFVYEPLADPQLMAAYNAIVE